MCGSILAIIIIIIINNNVLIKWHSHVIEGAPYNISYITY